MVSEAVGVLVAVVVQGQLVTKYRKSGDCADNGEVPDSELDKEVHVILAVWFYGPDHWFLENSL